MGVPVCARVCVADGGVCGPTVSDRRRADCEHLGGRKPPSDRGRDRRPSISLNQITNPPFLTRGLGYGSGAGVPPTVGEGEKVTGTLSRSSGGPDLKLSTREVVLSEGRKTGTRPGRVGEGKSSPEPFPERLCLSTGPLSTACTSSMVTLSPFPLPSRKTGGSAQGVRGRLVLFGGGSSGS